MKVSDLIFFLQAFPPASIIFAGIGVLLSVSELCGFLAQFMLIPGILRRPTMSAPAKTSSLTSSTA